MSEQYGAYLEETKQQDMRFAQCLRGHPALIVLLPATWRYVSPHQQTGSRSSGSWRNENGKPVPKDEVMDRLEARIIDLYSFYPTEAELRYIHDDLLVPLYSADALSRFLHTFLYPDKGGSVRLAELWQAWSKWQHRTVEAEAALHSRMRLRRLALVDGALLGWEWRKPPVVVSKPPRIVKPREPKPHYDRCESRLRAKAWRLGLEIPGDTAATLAAVREREEKPLTVKQERMRRDYDEAVRLGIAVPGNYRQSYENLRKWRAARG